ncbi:MAG: DUF4168 domain-containing protein [Halothece sp.]
MKHSSILLGTITSAFLFVSQTATVAQHPNPRIKETSKQPVTSNSTGSNSNGSNSQINKKEFQRFANAFKGVQKIRNESRKKIEQAIKKQGLTTEEYKTYIKQQQNAKNDSNQSKFSEQKQQKFKQAEARIKQIAQETRTKLKEAIAKEGFKMQRFKEIWTQVQADQKLQQKLKQKLQNSQS